MATTQYSNLTAQNVLSRIVRSESALSDLLAFFATTSPEPLRKKLELPQGSYTFHREYSIPNRQLDILVLNEAGEPAAVIEVKGAAKEHNDQLNAYAEWARTTVASRKPVLVVAPFDNEDFEAAEGWRVFSLLELFEVWVDDEDHSEISWLASQVRDIFVAWDVEAKAPLKDRTGHYISTVATRRTARALNQRLATHIPHGECKPFGTKSVNPALGAWIPLPGDLRVTPPSGQMYLLLDVRQASHIDPQKPWTLRLLVDVDGHDPDDADEALECALKVARDIYTMLSIQKLREYGGDLLSVRGNQRGLKRNVSEKPTLRDFFFDKPKYDSFRRVGVKYDIDLPEHERADVEEFCYSVFTGAYAAIRHHLESGNGESSEG